jgi:hypothetical protein
MPASLCKYHLLIAVFVGGFLPNAAINLTSTVTTGFDRDAGVHKQLFAPEVSFYTTKVVARC